MSFDERVLYFCFALGKTSEVTGSALIITVKWLSRNSLVFFFFFFGRFLPIWTNLLLLLLLLSRLSRVRLCETPEMAAHQAPPSLGFSRQEHWSGLPFSSPLRESEK